MPRPPVPYPLGLDPTTPIATVSFANYVADGWTKTGDAEIIDWWDAPNAYLHGNNGLGTWFDGNPPARRSTQIAKTVTGFTPGQRVRVEIDANYKLGTGLDGNAFIGTEINGVRGGLGTPIFDTDTRTFEIVTAVNEDGELDFVNLASSIPTSVTVDHSWIEARVFPATASGDFADIIINTAVVHVDGAALSITRGGATFDPREEWDDYDYPGKTAPVDGLRELVGMAPVIRVTAMMTGESQISAYRPDGTWADHASVAGARTFTPNAMRAALATSISLTNVLCYWQRAGGDYIAVEFPKALCRRYGIGGRDKDEGEIPIEIEAVRSGSTPLYRIHTFPAGYTVGP